MAQDPLIGQQLANFRIERTLGRGGMALVYYGWDVRLERPVAIKIIDARYRDDPTYAQRFVREAQAVAQWRHDNIIQIYYADDEAGLYYFVMEYIDGMDLRTVLHDYAEREALMPYADVLMLGRAIASALDYAHEKGIIHRDVKPANVLISYDDRVVLTDFGLALNVEQGTQGMVFGSSHYVAPEQARNSADACPQSDLYALGVILYEMLTGVVPFDDPSPTTVALQHVTQPPPPPCSINPLLSEEVEAVLLKALSKTPKERFSTGEALMDALEVALNTPTPMPETDSRKPSRALTAEGISDTMAWHQSPEPEAATTELIGSQLDEYRLEALLGQGGMARVYRGLDVQLKRWVAVKVIDSPFRNNTDYAIRFEREAQAIAQLEHPHIVRIYRYGEANGLLYMAMQYIEGTDLDYVLRSYRENGEFMVPEDAMRIVREIGSALDYAHEKGIIHRDIKPSNIMLDKQGNAILADFGLALLTEVGTRGEIFGSPHYIAPEQAVSSAAVVPQSDLYAMGVILYEIFTGQVPFYAELPLDIAIQHINTQPPPPREVCPALSEPLEAVILKALAKEPNKRYQSGTALADALEYALRTPTTFPRLTQISIPQQVAAGLASRPLPALPESQPEPLPGIVWPQSQPWVSIPEVPSSQPQPPAQAPVDSSQVREQVVQPPVITVPQVGIPTTTDSTSPAEPVPIYKEKTNSGFPRWLPFMGVGILFLLVIGGIFRAGELLNHTTPTVSYLSPNTPTIEMQFTNTPQSTLTEPSTPIPTSIPVVPEIGGQDTETPETTTQPVEMPISTATTTAIPPTETPVTDPFTAYNLRLVKQGDDVLYLVNPSTEPFPLAGLQLMKDNTTIEGTAWSIQPLPPGACVAVARDPNKLTAPPEGLCMPLEPLEVIKRDRKEHIWKDAFEVYYGGEQVLRCEASEEECAPAIPVAKTRYLMMIRKAADGLFIIHQGSEPLPLAQIRFVTGPDDNNSTSGSAWGINTLLPGECVVAWKNEDAPEQIEGFMCQQVGELLVLQDKKAQFWKEEFRIKWGEDQELGLCKRETTCFVPETAWTHSEDDD